MGVRTKSPHIVYRKHRALTKDQKWSKCGAFFMGKNNNDYQLLSYYSLKTLARVVLVLKQNQVKVEGKTPFSMNDCLAILDLSQLVESALVKPPETKSKPKNMGMIDHKGRWVNY
ncbi:MAG: hypothetical protein ACD_40C00331G0002 [uncultured bacterium]|nr:MAG: hypothetical protein ACD_40C00331G0002 [uncultured bacterium]